MAQPRRINLDEQAKIGSLSTLIIADNAVTTPKLAPSSITGDKFDPAVAGDGLVLNVSSLDVNVDDSTLEVSSDVVQVKDGGVTTAKLNIDADLSFNNNQSLSFRLENLSADPAPGNPGRLIWRTDLLQIRVDDGTSFSSLTGGGGGHTIQEEGSSLPQRAKLNFVGTGVIAIDDSGNDATVITIPTIGHVIEDEGGSITQRAILNFVGSGVTVSDGGAETTVTIPGGGGSTSFAQDAFVVAVPANKNFVLSNTPTSNSQIVTWNGVVLTEGAGNDYTVSGSTVTLSASIVLTIGDQILVAYAF